MNDCGTLWFELTETLHTGPGEDSCFGFAHLFLAGCMDGVWMTGHSGGIARSCIGFGCVETA